MRISGWPWCDRCGRRAESIVQNPYDSLRRGWEFIVYCHGEEEATILTHLNSVEATEISFGKVFKTKLEITHLTLYPDAQHISAKQEAQAIKRKINHAVKRKEEFGFHYEKDLIRWNKRIEVIRYFLNPCFDFGIS